MNQVATEDFQKAIANETALNCIENTPKSTNGAESVNENGCKDVWIRAAFCVFEQFFNACPADLQDSSERCNQLRAAVKNGELRNFRENERTMMKAE